MVKTYCSYCGELIDTENEKNKGKRNVLCSKNCLMVPIGANSYNKRLKGGGDMAKEKEESKKEKEVKVKKITLSEQIRSLLKEDKSVDEISKTLNCPRKKILDQRWLMNNKKK